MSEWINAKTNPPQTDIIAMVGNEKGWMWHVMARYIKASNVWLLFDSSCKLHLLLDVTHYVEVPQHPPKKEQNGMD